MNILHVVPTYLPAVRYGGPIYSVHGLCKALSRLGHRIDIFTTNVDGSGASSVSTTAPVLMDGVNVRYFKCEIPRLYWSASMASALHEQIKSYDIVHIHSVFLRPTWIAARIAERANVPYIVAPRGMLVRDLIQKKSRLAKMLWICAVERRTLARAAAIHATSDLEADEIRKFGLRTGPIVVIPNGIDAEAVPAADIFDSRDSRMVLFLGRINWKKGLDILIKAFRHVPNALLCIAGNDEDGYTKKLERLVRDCGLSGRVTFTGAVYGEQKNDILRRAALVALTSRSENFGNVVLEAMSAARPVLVSREVGAAEIVRRHGAGEIAESLDAERLGAQICDLLKRPADLFGMGQRGRNAVLQEYTWDSVAHKCAELYRGLHESSDH